MSTTPWSSELVLGENSLDIAHRALFAALARLTSLPEDDFSPALEECVAAVERDFRAEEALMEQVDYKPLQLHREQHTRVLSGLHHAAAALAEGNSGPAREAVFLLGEWLPLHIMTMDRALALAAEPSSGPSTGGT